MHCVQIKNMISCNVVVTGDK